MTYSVGLVGVRRGSSLIRAFTAMSDCVLAAACDSNPEALEGFSEDHPSTKLYTDYDDMLESGLDVLVVATPIPLHREHSTKALEAGCHVLQEVTLSSTIEDCQALAKVVRAHPKQKFMLGENCCYWAHIMSWTELWRQGRLGRFMYAESEYVHDIRALLRNPDGTPTWRAKRPPIVYCTHSLGPLLKITGQRCVTASALHTGSVLEPELGHIDMEVAIFQTSGGGVIKILRGQAVTREPAFHYYSVYGTRGCLETSRPPTRPLQTNAWFEDFPHLGTMIEMPISENVPRGPAAAMRVGGHGTAEYYMVSDFMDSVRNDKPSPIDIEAGFAMTIPGLCAHESALKGGTAVPVPDLR